MSQRTGILGGSFNPPHNGHLAMADAALDRAHLDRVLFIPAATPPHKLNLRDMAPAPDRLAMLRAALSDRPRCAIWEGELHRGGVSYTIDTVRSLRTEFPADSLVLIIGGDTLRELHTWREIDRLLELVEVATLVRPGVPAEAMRPALPALWQDRLLAGVVPAEPVDASSTEIRRRVAVGEAIASLVPAAVDAYIRNHGLYRT